MADDETVYCVCRRPYDEKQFMIQCDICKDWFHGSCVGIAEYQAPDIEIYHCPNCQIDHGPLVLKKRRNFHRHDYSESDENVSLGIQTGTIMFVKELKNRPFPSADDIILRMQGHELCMEFLEENGFASPIVVDRKDGLDLRVPPPNFTIQDVENHVGSMRVIDVIDVARQDDYKMLMREWTEYYNSPNRSKIYNVISLEFSKTRLADLVEPPRIVREISWVHTLWPESDSLPEEEQDKFLKPEVSRYCLMGIKDSFTDFHIDFGGTSVWYHVLRGEKVFYLVEPTLANITLYERWISSASQSETFFGDMVDACYKLTVKQGQTLFIPTGWIHAVLTPIDSLVFGGNFLSSYNIELQIAIYDLERRCKTPDKYLFPNFETLHWYAAKHVLDVLRDLAEEGKKPTECLVTGARALASALKSWTHKKEFTKKENIPETIQYGRLLKELNKEVKNLQQKSITEERKWPKRQKKAKIKDYDVLDSPGPMVKKEKGKSKSRGKNKKAKEKMEKEVLIMKRDSDEEDSAPDVEKTEDDVKPSHLMSPSQLEFGKVLSDDEFKMRLPKKKEPNDSPGHGGQSSQQRASLKVRIPKAGAFVDTSVYDFSDEPDSDVSLKSPLSSPEAKRRTPGSVSSNMSSPLSGLGSPNPLDKSGLKLKVSNGKIVNEMSQSPKTPGRFQPLSFRSPVRKDSITTPETEELVVDDSPIKEKTQDSMKAGSLKMKLSLNRSSYGSVSSSKGQSEGSPRTHAKQTSEISPGARANMPTIQGGLNGSIADILQASGYGTETDFRVDKNISGSSPNMRDAIAGMLTMSQGSQPTSLHQQRQLQQQRAKKRIYAYDEDAGERMPTCFKDKEYVYPTLDHSDTEDEKGSKIVSKSEKDDTWNPKVKMSSIGPKMERQKREGVMKEAVESGLAAAAAKLANQPAQKRQYKRKKPKAKTSPTPPANLSRSAPASLFTPGFRGPNEPLSPPDSPLSTSLSIATPPWAGSSTSSMSKAATSSSKPRVKKGMATSKQRLGKILKLNKMFR